MTLPYPPPPSAHPAAFGLPTGRFLTLRAREPRPRGPVRHFPTLVTRHPSSFLGPVRAGPAPAAGVVRETRPFVGRDPPEPGPHSLHSLVSPSYPLFSRRITVTPPSAVPSGDGTTGDGRADMKVMGSVRGSFLRSFPCPSTRPTRGRSVHRHSGSSSLTFLVTSFLFTSLSSRPFGAHFIRPGTGPLASLASLVRDVPSLGLRPSLPSVGRDKC